MPTALVTGGAGFIGSHVIDAYLAHRFRVVVVDNLSSGRRQNINPGAVFYAADIQDRTLADIFAKEKPEIVNHHAAQVSVQRSLREPVFDAQTNILGSLNLLQMCVQFKVRKLIFASSGGAIYGEPNYLPCDEEHHIAPQSPYGVSKQTVENFIHLYGRLYGLNHTILRYGNVYGPRQDPYGEAGVIAIFARHMIAGEPVTINGSGDQQRDFVFVGDLVTANLHALDKGDGGTYNLGTGIGTSVNQIVSQLKIITGYPLEPHHGSPLSGEVFRIWLGIEKAHQELGWQPQVTLAEGLARTVDFFRSAAK